MASLVIDKVRQRGFVLDPAVGTGRLLAPFSQAFGAERRVFGVEIQKPLADWTGRQLPDAQICCGDALDLIEPHARERSFGHQHFEAIVSNPPYVREKNHAAEFKRLRADPRWKPVIQPRQDLQQLFLHLGIELLSQGGDLVFLMNSYWLTTDHAASLRHHVNASCHVEALVDFGETRLFPDAPGQHGLLIHLTKRNTARKTTFARVKRAVKAAELTALCEDLDQLLRNGEMPSRLSDCVEVTSAPSVRASGDRQRWYFPCEHESELAAIEGTGVTLGDLFETRQGVVSGADRVTQRNRELIEGAARLGEGIFLLNGSEVADLDLSPPEMRFVRAVVRAKDIEPFRANLCDTHLLLMHRGSRLDALPSIKRHLGRFRGVLSQRREVREGKIPWFELHWPREKGLFDRPRLITPRRALQPRFAPSRHGWCEQSDIALILHKEDDEELLHALMVLLNSRLFAKWSRYRGKHKGKVREFFGGALQEIPLPSAAAERPQIFRSLAAFAESPNSDAAEGLIRRLYLGS